MKESQISVKIDRDLKKELEDIKVHPRQAINEIVWELFKFYKQHSKKYKTLKTKGKTEG